MQRPNVLLDEISHHVTNASSQRSYAETTHYPDILVHDIRVLLFQPLHYFHALETGLNTVQREARAAFATIRMQEENDIEVRVERSILHRSGRTAFTAVLVKGLHNLKMAT